LVPPRLGHEIVATFTGSQEGVRCPLWVKSQHMRCNKACPLYPRLARLRALELPNIVRIFFGDKKGATMKQILIPTVPGFGLLMSGLPAALPADITVLASNGVKAAVTELVPQFEKETGHKLNFIWGASNLLVKQVEAGEAFDAVIVTPALIKGLIM